MKSAGTEADFSGRYQAIRATTERICDPLSPEDCTPQSMPDASPVKWHLAHTSWFFETFVLEPALAGYRPYHPDYRELFNSYYNAVGPQHFRPERGLVTRPGLGEVLEYRRHVDEHVDRLLDAGGADAEMLGVLELGLQHEQQHQELVLTDVKHLLSKNPLHPVYREGAPVPPAPIPALAWHDGPAGLQWLGHEGPGFVFDNEIPRHRVHLVPFELASRLVTNGEYLDFMQDGGYARPDLWLSDGWATVVERGWQAPLYWEPRGSGWAIHTLSGRRALRADEPVVHVSFYEADAFARWAGARLATEAEWEASASALPVKGNFLENEGFHPAPLAAGAVPDGPAQLFGDVWEWTASAYAPYPGYRPPKGALGEYNGKFMCNQLVLRGGSCVSSNAHVRPTYRNFFYADARWQFSGIRLARDAAS